jgi:hypothetical protein
VVGRDRPLCGFFETLKSSAVIGSGGCWVTGNGHPVSADRSWREGIGEEGRCREGAWVSGFARLLDGERRQAFGFRGASSFAGWCWDAWLRTRDSSEFPDRGWASGGLSPGFPRLAGIAADEGCPEALLSPVTSAVPGFGSRRSAGLRVEGCS